MAERAESSVATVVRFAQKLGYRGFMEMRQALVAQAKAKTARRIGCCAPLVRQRPCWWKWPNRTC